MKLLTIITTIGILLLLSGCKTIREARDDRREEKVKTWLTLNEEKFAALCAEKFPASADSTTKTEHKPADNEDYTRQIDSLSKIISGIDSTWFLVLDSATTETSEAYVQRIRELQKVIADLSAAIGTLREKYKPCKPDTLKTKTHVVTIDSAALRACLLANVRLVAEVSGVSGERTEWKAKAKERFWIIVALGAIIVALVTALVFIIRGKNRIKKVTNTIDSILPDRKVN